MTIAQRIELRRLGYTKDEIAELAKMESVPEPQTNPVGSQDPAAESVSEQKTTEPAPVPEPTPAAPNTGEQLLIAINNLTAALQNNKLNTTPQPVPVRPETAEDIFNNILKG